MNPPKPFSTNQFGKSASKQEVYETWINGSQVRNPVWNYLKIQKLIKANQIADIILPQCSVAIIFLQLQFHQQYPLYVHDKFEKFLQSEEAEAYNSHVLLMLFDGEDFNDMLMDLSILCCEKNFKLLVGFNYSEISSFVSSFKQLEKGKLPFLKEKERRK